MLAGAPVFLSQLSSTLQQLASDESPCVRRTVASGYHEVVGLLGDKSMSAANIYHTLLCDKSTEVCDKYSVCFVRQRTLFSLPPSLSGPSRSLCSFI